MGRPAPGALTEVGSQFSPAVSLPMDNKHDVVVATHCAVILTILIAC